MDELLELEERFQPFLLNDDYTFIGPTDINLLNEFTRTANRLAPVVAISRSVHHALSHTPSTRTAIGILPPGTELRIYVVIRTNDPILFHATIEEYCDRNNINFGI
ncbi:MAG: hypothetical protein KDC67_04570 [Ignavibacteriae bacterium]|jgi:hypothetical protein|nr:hypothetical protein [Ignavibacteriota bacterium]